MTTNTATPAPSMSPAAAKPKPVARLFYPAAAWLMLAITLYGFQHFYFKGQAFPGRPLTPPIKTLLIVHGVTMLLWIALFIVQPMLITKRKLKLHKTLGRFGAVLALALVVMGFLVGIGAARVNPPDLQLYGMNPPQFLYVPITAISTFGLMVILAIAYVDKPQLHRGLMLIGTVAALSAAMGRFDWLNKLCDGTLWFKVFGPLHSSVSLCIILLIVRCVMLRKIDTWLAVPAAALILIFTAMHAVSYTAAWDSFARSLMG